MPGLLNIRYLAMCLTLLLSAVPVLAGARAVEPPSQNTRTSAAPQSQRSYAPAPQIRSGSSRGQTMTPRQQAHVRAQAHEFRQMSPVQQSQVRQAFHYYQSLPEPRRRALRSQWQHEAEREQALQVDPRMQPQRTGPQSQ